MTCKSSIPFPASNNTTLQEQLNQTLWQLFSLHTNGDTASLGDTLFLSSIYCSMDSATQCYGICPNADLAGVGVRTAFWISSILQAILVAISPEDSTQGAWTAAVLTASVIIPAIIQKRQGNLSIYHATLVLNFASFASLVSLAVAPMCTVWRQGPTEEDALRTSDDGNPIIEVALYGEEGSPESDEDQLTNLPKRKVHRERLMLSLALLTQVALQWTWVAVLFTDPNYCQKACVPETIVLLFGFPLSVHELNRKYFALWLLWLLFNLSITLIWGTLLVHSSSPSVHPILSRQPSRVDLSLTWRDRFPLDKGRLLVLSMNTLAFLLAVLLLVSSELQVTRNGLLGGENFDWSFGQIAALLVALVPAWPILAAIGARLNHSRQKSDTSFSPEDAESNLQPDRGSSAPASPVAGLVILDEKSSSTVEVLCIQETPIS